MEIKTVVKDDNTVTTYITNPSPQLLEFIKKRQEEKRIRMEELRQKYLKELNG